METIKKKINGLKELNEIKQDEIERLQEQFFWTQQYHRSVIVLFKHIEI